MRLSFKKTNQLLPLLVAVVVQLITWPVSAEVKPHDKMACGNCHIPGAFVADSQGGAKGKECLSCHNPADLTLGNFHSPDSRDCLGCHSFHSPGIVTTLMGDIQLDAAGQKGSGHCLSCHDPRGTLGTLSPGHKVAAGLYHTEAKELNGVSPSQVCLRCHDNASSSTWQVATGGHLSFNTHASHPYSVEVIPGKGDSSNWIASEIDVRLTMFEGKMECQTCHLLTADNEDLMVPFETKYDLCLGCHKHQRDDKQEEEGFLATFMKR